MATTNITMTAAVSERNKIKTEPTDSSLLGGGDADSLGTECPLKLIKTNTVNHGDCQEEVA